MKSTSKWLNNSHISCWQWYTYVFSQSIWLFYRAKIANTISIHMHSLSYRIEKNCSSGSESIDFTCCYNSHKLFNKMPIRLTKMKTVHNKCSSTAHFTITIFSICDFKLLTILFVNYASQHWNIHVDNDRKVVKFTDITIYIHTYNINFQKLKGSLFFWSCAVVIVNFVSHDSSGCANSHRNIYRIFM